jgi:hypothetical protein
MRIGKWTINLVRWGIRFERAYPKGALMVSWDELSKHYSAEEVQRWRDELDGHLSGTGLQLPAGKAI